MSEAFWKIPALPEGYAVEAVRISSVKARYDRQGEGFLESTFAPEERAEAGEVPDWEYLAGRLAVKHGILKLLSRRISLEAPDPRQVVTLRRQDGSPCVHIRGSLGCCLQAAGIGTPLVSITNEDDYALAFCHIG